MRSFEHNTIAQRTILHNKANSTWLKYTSSLVLVDSSQEAQNTTRNTMAIMIHHV